MKKRTRTFIGSLVTLGISASLLSIAAPASAAELIPENEIQSMTIMVTSRTGTEQGTSALNWGPDSVTTSTGCPEGFRESSRTFIVSPDGTETSAALPRTSQTAPAFGLQGNPMDLFGTRASNWEALTEATLPTGLNKFVVTCDALVDGVRPATTDPIGDAKYFVAYLQVDRAAESWTQVPAPTVPVVKVTPTVAFTTATANADGSVTLTATVSGDAGVATNATGVVSISGSYSGLTTPVSGEAAVSAGVATWTTPVLDAGQTYSFTAGYTANGDTKYTDSAANATTTVITVAEPTPPQNTDITVTIPESATGLKFTMTPGAVALNQAALDGTSYVATGSLGEVTVSDNRTTRIAWTLSGNATDFVNAADATQTIAASSLGWKPALVGATNAGAAGIEVIAGASGGLTADTPLAQATAGLSTADTTINAGITLKAPADSAAGDYSATLTLTLI